MSDTLGSAATPKSDTERLHELGYAQELGRKMQGFSNVAVSFSIISILAGCLTTYYNLGTAPIGCCCCLVSQRS